MKDEVLKEEEITQEILEDEIDNTEEENSEVLEDKEFEQIIEEETVESLKSEKKKIQDELSKVNNEFEALKERLLRISAEYDNFRKRTAKEKEGIYTDACVDILKTMFPVLDNLERAASTDGSLEDIKKGIEMTLRQFKDSIEKLNVEEIPTEEGFDPNLHSAVMHVQDEAYGVNSIVEVFQKGYKKGEKVIRHSMVKVAN